MKTLILLLLVVTSCKVSQGPVYQGRSHNEQLRNNKRVVSREDARMKKAMIKARNKASKNRKAKRVQKRNKRKFI
jgi:hypothetical protein